MRLQYLTRIIVSRRIMRWGVLVSLLVMVAPIQLQGRAQTMPHQHGTSAAAGDRSPSDKSFSEFNHRLAGLFVLIMGTGEISGVLSVPTLARLRFLLPLGMLGAGGYLVIWSDADTWAPGSSFIQPLLAEDWETIQHKLYAILLLGVGFIELFRQMGRIEGARWRMPLPLFAIFGGLLLFVHRHHVYSNLPMIELHHRIMGSTALLAGGCKLAPEFIRSSRVATRGTALSPMAWELVWSVLILLIGMQLLLYTE